MIRSRYLAWHCFYELQVGSFGVGGRYVHYQRVLMISWDRTDIELSAFALASEDVRVYFEEVGN